MCRCALLFLCTFAALAVAADEEVLQLWQAVAEGDRDKVQELLGSGQFTVSEIRGEVNETLLHNATAEDQIEVLRLLLEAWPQGVQSTDRYGRTPLHSASSRGVAQILLEAWPRGAEAVTSGRTGGRTPLHYAAWYGHFEVVQLLLEAWPTGAEAVDKYGRTPLSDAAWSGHVEVLQVLLEAWPNGAKAVDIGGWTPLHVAARNGHLQVVQLLLDAWPGGIEAVDSLGSTPLHDAARSGQFQTVQLLLEAWPKGAEAVDKFGSTPWQVAPCGPLIPLACNGTDTSQGAVTEAALRLDCAFPTPGHPLLHDDPPLTKPLVELWLECGGSVHWRSKVGVPLADKLEDPDAKAYVEALISSEGLAKTLQDYRTWVIPGAALILAGTAVCLEHKSVRWYTQWRNSQRDDNHEQKDPFLQGARILVFRAFGSGTIIQKFWRWLESFTAVFFFGWSLLLMAPQWWLPVVGLAHLLPALFLHGIVALLRTPVLAVITTTNSSRVVALLRTTILLGMILAMPFLISIGATDAAYESLASSLRNPLLIALIEEVVMRRNNRESAGAVSAAEITAVLLLLTVGAVGLYYICLLGAVLMGCTKSLSSHTSDRKGAADSQQRAMEQAVQELLQKEPRQFREVRANIVPVSAFPWPPWRGQGLVVSVTLILLDVALDINTALTFLASEHYGFAAVMTFVVARSTLKQMCIIPPWRLPEAVRASIRRGILREDVLDFLEEEKRSEALFCAWLTAYSMVFSVTTASQLLVQMSSLWLSIYMFALYVVQLEYKDTGPTGSYRLQPFFSLHWLTNFAKGPEPKCRGADSAGAETAPRRQSGGSR
ncbi:RIPK4 [Symbiodinium sp. KB8]|nr:RIPK4 [Symbiodinium sp. KB8]